VQGRAAKPTTQSKGDVSLETSSRRLANPDVRGSHYKKGEKRESLQRTHSWPYNFSQGWKALREEESAKSVKASAVSVTLTQTKKKGLRKRKIAIDDPERTQKPEEKLHHQEQQI